MKELIELEGIYRHWKGNFYRVKEVAYHYQDRRAGIVIYHRCDENGLFVSVYDSFDERVPQPFYRNVQEFNSFVSDHGINAERFKFIKKAR